MCVLDELSKECLSPENILRYVDEYSIYSHYIGEELELGARYSSPLRTKDDDPSFSLYQSKYGKIFFKDYAYDFKGDVFHFVRLLLGHRPGNNVPISKVYKQIDSDFNIGLYTENGHGDKFIPVKIVSKPVVKEKYTIQITSYKTPKQEYFDYWKDKYDITPDILDYYTTTQAQVVHYSSKEKTFQVYPKSLTIAYRVGGRYELYSPFERKGNRFRNDLPENWVKGFIQLKRINKFCIITKSMKEIIFFRKHFDWDSVSGKAEGIMIPHHLMEQLLSEYEDVYIWLDNDAAGQVFQQKYLRKYPSLIPIRLLTEQKDPTDRYDYMKQQGKANEALQEFINLIK